MLCPKCKRYMKPIVFEGVEVDRCTHCYGIWFDRNELDELKEIKGAEVIDIAETELGEEKDKQRKVFCPRCRTLMIPESDEQQRHIHYERCPDCKGVFFDSGEFRDLKKLTISEFLRQFLPRRD